MFYLNELQGVQKNVPLASYTTFKIGGKAKYFYEAKSGEDLMKAIKAAKMPVFILGSGSNVLVSDKGFNGLVIKLQATSCKLQATKMVADAGVLLSKLVDESVKKGLTGLEWAAGIPGTVGGAIRGNAGAFDSSMADIVRSVTVLETPSLKVKTLKNKDCKFGYRESIFKHGKDLLILSVELEFKKGDKKRSQEIVEEHLARRKEKQPLEYPSAGSIFKNPEGQSAGHLIEQCGLKGKKVGGAMISKKHSNFIVNLGNAKAEDVKKIIDLCKEKVREKFGIELEEEIECLGEF